jgi:hypothetical protein
VPFDTFEVSKTFGHAFSFAQNLSPAADRQRANATPTPLIALSSRTLYISPFFITLFRFYSTSLLSPFYNVRKTQRL